MCYRHALTIAAKASYVLLCTPIGTCNGTDTAPNLLQDKGKKSMAQFVESTIYLPKV